MKKLLTLLVTLMLSLSMVFAVGCGKEPDKEPTPAEPVSYSFYAPDGAPALSIAKFINDKETFGINGTISYNVIAATDIGPTMAQGKADFIIMPVNAASKLYNKKADNPYKMASVITHGNLYMMSSDSTDTLEGLKGKVVGVIGQGLVPDLTLRAVLAKNNLLDSVVTGDTATEGKITLKYFAAAPDLLPMLKTGKLSVGLLPEPAATNLTNMAKEKTWTRIDLQKAYDSEKMAYPQAVLMIKKSVLDKETNIISTIASKFNDNMAWVKSNTADAVAAVTGALKEGLTPSMKAPMMTATVIDNCKIFWQSANDSKQEVKDYIDSLIALDNKSAVAIVDQFFA